MPTTDYNTSRARFLSRPGRNGTNHADATLLQLVAEKIISQSEFFRYGYASDREATSLTNPLTQVAIVYACVVARARPLAQCPLKVYTRDAQGEPVEAVGSPLDSLLWRPNPITSLYQFVESWEMSICVNGEAFVLKEAKTPASLPTALWLLPPKKMEAEADSRGVPLRWKYTGNASGSVVYYEPWQVIHDKLANPDNPTRGLSPLTPALADIAQEFDVTRWNRSFLQNDCDPGGRFEIEGGGPISQEQLSAVMRNFKARNGGPNNTGRPMVDVQGLKFNRNPIAHKEMSFQDQREFNLRGLKMSLGVPTAALGITEDIPYAAFRGQMRAFWETVLIPRCRSIEDVLWSSWLHEYEGGKYELLFDLKAVQALREDVTEKVAAVAPLFNAGVPLQEISRLLNLGVKEFEGWEVSYIPAGIYPAGSEPLEPVPQKSAKERVEFSDFTESEMAEAKSWDSEVVRPNEKAFGTQWRKWVLAHRNVTLDRFREVTGWDWESKDAKLPAVEKADRYFDPDSALPVERELWEKLVSGVGPIYERTIVDGAGSMAARIGTEAQITTARGELAEWLRKTCLGPDSPLKGATNRIRHVLRESLAEGIQEGETLYELAGRIKTVHKAAGNRAMVISRTEVGRAANKGALAEAEESGVVKANRWNAAMDGATRETHRAAHIATRSNPVPLGKKFHVGNAYLDYPTQFDAAHPEETIACRCILSPVLKEPDELEVEFLD